MGTDPRNQLQKLAEVALELCGAHTAGISLSDTDVVRWEAVAGVCAGARGRTMRRAESPCGLCIDRGETQLLHLANRCFPLLPAERFVEMLLVPFHDRDVSIGAVWLVSHTDDRQFDLEDERILRQLSRFASAGWRLLQSMQRSAQLNLRKDHFLAMLGHELRNPLGAILRATWILRQQVAENRVGVEATNIIDRQSRSILRLADDLLDVAQIETGKLRLEREQIDLRSVVGNAVEATRPQIDRRQHTLSVDLGTAPVFIDGDADRLGQVVMNLLDNAAKYTPLNGNISVAISSNEGNAVVSVRDDGVGVPPDRASEIFAAFTQLEPSGTSASGVGLGLALVKSLTEMHGGKVAVESGGCKQGSCFSIQLPVFATDGPRGGQAVPLLRRKNDRRRANRPSD